MRTIIALLLAIGAVRSSDGQQPSRSQQHGRLFSPKDLGLLEAPDRDLWQRPDQIMDALGIADASVVADVGAGSGWFTVRLARRVGPNGIVYAQDVQQEMLAAITRRVQREGLTKVRPVLGLGTDPHLPRGKLDAILMVGVYNEIDDPVDRDADMKFTAAERRVRIDKARRTMLKNLGAALKPQGRLGVIEFRLNGAGGPGPPVEERVDPQVVVRDAAEAELRLLSQESFLPYQYFLIFARQAKATKNGERSTEH